MTSTPNLAGNYVLLTGSISRSIADALIDRAHQFVESFVKEVIAADGGFVVFVAAEQLNERQKPLLFDWSILATVNQLLPGASLIPRLKVVASLDRLKQKATPEQLTMLFSMFSRGLAEHVQVSDDIVTGSNIGEEQADIASAMVALGGGTGVLDRANKMAKRHLPVIPMDLELGALSEDGPGATRILSNFQSSPRKYMPNTGVTVVKNLPGLSLQYPALSMPEIAKRLVSIFYEEQQARVAAQPPDVLILTALDIELRAAKLAFGIAEGVPPIVSSTGLHVWRASVVRADGSTARCVVGCFAGAGNIDSAAVTSTLLMELKPAHVMMLGIAAGLREKKCALGEVHIVERVVAYEGAALVNGTVEARSEITRLTMKVRQDVSTYLSDMNAVEQRLAQKYKAMGIEFPEESDAGPVTKGFQPKTVTIASGEKLLRDGEKFTAMRELHAKIESAEMEAAGLFAACSNQNKSVLMIRGISDFGDATKSNGFHALAAKAAAAVTADYVAHGITKHP